MNDVQLMMVSALPRGAPGELYKINDFWRAIHERHLTT